MTFKMRYKIAVLTLAVALLGSNDLLAGNKDRAGSAGGTQLLINPWARSAGLGNSNMASIGGLESSFLNVAGLAFTKRTEVGFTYSDYLSGSDISVNAFGIAQRIGETSVLSLSVSSMNIGDIQITTEDVPAGGIGDFSPTFSNLALSYAKEFSNSIYGGITFRVISESISNITSSGIALDAGIRYVTGERDHVNFGIALKNVGPPITPKGDGLNTPVIIISNGTAINADQRVASSELPSLVNIGFSYNFLFNENMDLTASGQFTSNSFSRDQIGLGAELNMKSLFQLRAGYLWEDKITSDTESTTALTGLTAGGSVGIPLGSDGRHMGFDYSYRTTVNFGGIHSIGAHITL